MVALSTQALPHPLDLNHINFSFFKTCSKRRKAPFPERHLQVQKLSLVRLELKLSSVLSLLRGGNSAANPVLGERAATARQWETQTMAEHSAPAAPDPPESRAPGRGCAAGRPGLTGFRDFCHLQTFLLLPSPRPGLRSAPEVTSDSTVVFLAAST